jgi:hypothetical protein
MKKHLLFSLILGSILNMQIIYGQSNKGCDGPSLSTDHGGYCEVSIRFVDTVYFNTGDSVKFTYGASGSSCVGIFNNQIFLNGSPINTPSTNIQFEYYTTNIPGTYRFTWTQMIACDFTIELIENTPLSINSTKNELTTTVFPNPASNILNIGGTMVFKKVVIINLSGEIVKAIASDSNEIDVSELNNGIYFIRLYGIDEVITKKFIKN